MPTIFPIFLEFVRPPLRIPMEPTIWMSGSASDESSIWL